MKLHARLAMILAVGFWLAAQAQSMDNGWRNFQSRQWLKEDGLPDNFVTTLLQTHDKYLWVGTMSGLARFDGARFEPELPGPSRTNETTAITALYEDRANQLWVGTSGQGLFVHSNNVFAPLAGGGALPRDITCLAQDRNGDFWVGTDAGLARLRGAEKKLFTKADGLPDDFVSAAHAARSGALWITTRAGMCEMRDGRLFPMELQTQGLGRDPEFLGIYEDRQTNLWAFGDTFLVNLKDGKRFNYFRNGDLASFRIWSLCEGRNGQLWIGTSGQGVFSFAQGRFAPVSFRERLVSSDVRAICEDDQGDVWLGSLGGGLIRMQRRSWQQIGLGAGLPDEPPSALTVTPGGQLWAGYLHSGLYRASVNHGESGDAAVAVAGEPLVASLAAAPDGSLWMGSYGQGVFRLESGGAVEQFTTADGLSDNIVPAVCVDRSGSVWAGCRSGILHRMEGGKIARFGAPDQTSSAAISSLTASTAGGVWLGTDDGRVWRTDGEEFVEVAAPRELRGRAIRTLFEDSQGRLWIGASAAGLGCVSTNRTEMFDAERGFPESEVAGIAEDAEHNLWARGSRALWRIPRKALEELGSGNLRAEEVFSESPGLAGLEMTGGLGAARGADGSLYFASAHGALQVDPGAWQDSAPPFPVVLESVTVFDNARVITRWENEPDEPAQTLPPGARAVEFHFTAVDLSSPERVRFQHQLENFDADWVDGGPERFIRYGRLPPGKYEFRVRASRGNGAWREAPNAFAFEVVGSPWASPLAVACYTLLGVAGVALAVRVISHRRLRRNLAALAQQQAMEKERMRIAQNMHDEIGSQLTRISFLSEIALRGQEPAAENLQSIAATSQKLLQTLDEIVWAVNPQNDTLEHLAAYLGHYADEYFQNTGVELEMQIEQGLRHYPLSSEARHNLFLAFEEALGNVLKHSGAPRVRVEMQQTATHFVIRIKDEGRGFVVGGTANGYNGAHADNGHDGLVNIKQRLAQIGGECRIESAPRAGATVILALPLPVEEARAL